MSVAPTNTQQRIPGLDTLRALAIALVLCTHYSFVTHEATFGNLTLRGWVGVDLFFVLSGYLIGGQIMTPLARGESFSLTNFMARRFLRTLPNYYVVLALYLLLQPPALIGSGMAEVWRYLTFTQNLAFTRWGMSFSHSWSLCIEEQFYLVLPLAALLVARLRRSLLSGWGLALLALAGGMTARAWCWQHMPPDGDGATLYYSSLTRFDELLPGVLIAMLEHFHPSLLGKMTRRPTLLIAGGLALVLGTLVFWFDAQTPVSMAAGVLGYPALAFGFALLVMSCLNPASWLNRIRVPGAASLAAWSYAVYLAHKPIFQLLAGPLDAIISPKTPLGIAIVMAAGISGGWILYRLVETPFMRLRSRWFPSRTARSPGPFSVPHTEPQSL
jgi:peptidoglycan/LPS O-acetylase OafA/YrhL